MMNCLRALLILIFLLFTLSTATAQVGNYDNPLGNPTASGNLSFRERQLEREKKSSANRNKYNIKHDLPITLTGDYVEYLVEDERVVAKGAAEARHDKMDLIANNIEADMKKQVVFAQGDVIFWQRQPDGKLKKITGDFLVYHIETGDGFMKDAVIYQDPTLIRTPYVELSARKIVAPKGAVYTSCDQDNPHWSVRCSKVTVYPNDTLIMNNASYYLGDVPILSVGTRVMDLRKKEEKDFKTKLGYTKVKGFYQTLTWHYLINEHQYGDIDIDNSDRLGTFAKIMHNFKVKSRWQGQFSTDYSDDAVRNEIVQRSTFTGNVRLDKTATMNYNISEFYSKRGAIATNKELNSNINLNYNTKNYGIVTRFKKRSDLLKAQGSQIRSLDYLPEMQINTNRQKFYKMPLFLSTRSTLGTRSESYGGTVTKRNVFDSRWQVDSQRFVMSKKSNLNINSSYQIRRNDEDEKQTILSGGATYVQNIGDSINGNLRYNSTRTHGFTPFQSNQIDDQNKMTMNFAYNKKKQQYDKAEFRSNLFQTTYDLDTNRFGGVSSDVSWTWRKSKEHYWKLYLRGNTDYGDTILKNLFNAESQLTSLYMRFDLKDSENFNFNTSTTYDLNTHKYKTMNTRMNFKLNPFWKVDTDFIYDLETQKLRNVNYIFERDLHCWFMKFTARVKQKDYFLEFGLRAFPSDAQKFTKSKETGNWKREKTSTSTNNYF